MPRSSITRFRRATISAAAQAILRGWLFNNSILNLGAKEDAVAKITVRESGTYRLFVRAQGSSGAVFGFGGRQASADGTLVAVRWRVTSASSFDLKSGPW